MEQDAARIARLEAENEALRRSLAALERHATAAAVTRRQLAIVLATHPDCVKVVAPDGQLVDMNDAGLALLEVERAEALRRELVSFVLPAHREAFLEMHQRVCAGQSATLEFEIEGAQGTRRWLETRATPLRDPETGVVSHLAVTRDVTERRKAIENERRLADDLRRSNERFRRVTQATNDSVYDWDIASGRIQFYENFTATFGHEARGQTFTMEWWAEQLHPEERQQVIAALQAALDGGAAQWSEEYRFRHADGRWLHARERGVILRDEAGKPVRMIGAIADVTEHRSMQARLLLADRMASLGTMAAGIAHEINNPLAYVIEALERARETLREGGGPAWEAVCEAAHGVARVRTIVRDLKTFSHPAAEERAPTCLHLALESALAMALHEIRSRARVEREFGPVPLVEANSSQLWQLFLNLLINAAHAIPEGDGDHRIRIATSTDGAGRAVIEISDTGVGIPADRLERIFEPFFTTKPAGTGTGLGLSICRTIATSLGGEIAVASEPGRGTTFTVALPPAAAQVLPEMPTPEPPPPAAAPARRRVLVVDDDPMVGRAVARILRRAHDVELTTDPLQALEMIEAGTPFDVVISDLMMPGLSGMQLHEQIAAKVPHLADRMIFLTGGAFTAAAQAFLRRVENPRLEKPFEPAALLALIERMT